VVRLVEDKPEWDRIFGDEAKQPEVLIRPDMKKLDLKTVEFIPLQDLRASDSGRVAGPKAANLGELKGRFPDAVTDGLVIPFGVFRVLLDQPIEPGGSPMFRWMQDQYGALRRMTNDSEEHREATHRFLARVRNWIANVDPGPSFRRRLRSAMGAFFGPDGSYGVFVRSDTNVEDLPGFTGAGLNLTVPHVVGFDKVMEAIIRVWASPFTERAYAWRQAHMDRPEHVYVSVLLMKSVPAEKSGVMVTADLETGRSGWLSIAVNEGVGGVVGGQEAEELRVNVETGQVRVLAQATEPLKRILRPIGGVAKAPASGTDTVLKEGEVVRLIELARELPNRFPSFLDEGGRPVPADIEFGFHEGRLALFQIRPFLESSRAQQNRFLTELDRPLKKVGSGTVDLNEIPLGG
jgi:phosphoenolpyruvate synthase/pyruvate phosphate dikinase